MSTRNSFYHIIIY